MPGPRTTFSATFHYWSPDDEFGRYDWRATNNWINVKYHSGRLLQFTKFLQLKVQLANIS